MDARAAERQYRALRAARHASRLGDDEFARAVADLIWQDRLGRYWSIDPASGRRRCHGGGWVGLAGIVRPIDWARLAEAAILLGVAGLLLALWQRGTIVLYLSSGSAWLGLAAAPLLAVLALGRIWHGLGDEPSGPGGSRWYRLALLAAPLALGLALPARPLDANAAAGRQLNAVGWTGGARADQLASRDTATFDLFDWAVALTREPDHARFVGQLVRVEGFVVNDAPHQAGHRGQDEQARPSEGFSVVRFVITHCTADAAAVGLAVLAASGPALPDNTWVRVEGTLDLVDVGGVRKPAIVANVVRPLPAPSNPYLSP